MIALSDYVNNIHQLCSEVLYIIKITLYDLNQDNKYTKLKIAKVHLLFFGPYILCN